MQQQSTEELDSDVWRDVATTMNRSMAEVSAAGEKFIKAMSGVVPKFAVLDEALGREPRPYTKDKSQNTPEFNKKVKKRRVKAKAASATRKKNR